jgi:hypothetical protein
MGGRATGAAADLNQEEFTREMRLAAVITWYEQGKVSQEVAARIAGMNRSDFFLASARTGNALFGSIIPTRRGS